VRPSSKRGTEGYQRQEGDQDDGDRFWARYGFDSFEAYLDHLEEEQARFHGPPKVRVSELGNPAEDLPSPPDRSLDTRGAHATDARGEYRQVGVKLTPEDHKRLADLADSYCVSPTTMARMLVVRGVRGRMS
jgi:hypothetical protein